MEGTPIQEVAALEVNRSSNAIMDVFLAYAHTEMPDTFARNHIHGLSKNYLQQFGFPSEDALLSVLKMWLQNKPYVAVFANDSRKESQALGIKISDFKLAPWAERSSCASHKIALRYKQLSIPVLNRFCSSSVHASFVNAPSSPNAFSTIAKPVMDTTARFMIVWNSISNR